MTHNRMTPQARLDAVAPKSVMAGGRVASRTDVSVPAVAVQTESATRVGTLLTQLGLSAPRPVLVICGGADELRGSEFSRAESVLGVAALAAGRDTKAAIVDGGTASGVMALVGAARARDPTAIEVLLGVAPAGLVRLPDSEDGCGSVSLEAHHTHFLLADGDQWGLETTLLFDAAQQLAGGLPIVVVIAGGGKVALAEAAEAVRRGWPLIAVGGTGGAAEAIVEAVQPRRVLTHVAVDGPLAAIAESSCARAYVGADGEDLGRILVWELTDEPLLKEAWARFAIYDDRAIALRRNFERSQVAILGLGAMATCLALLHRMIGTATLHWSVVVLPIAISVLVAVAARLSAGQRWVSLRTAAESIKGEIYRYRTRTWPYRQANCVRERDRRNETLAARLDQIDAKLLHSPAGRASLPPCDKSPDLPAGDSGLNPLDGDDYLRIRLQDQVRYYRLRVRSLDRKRLTLNSVSILAGGAGAVLAAAGQEMWVALTAALSAASVGYLTHLRVDATVGGYNETAARLESIERGWRARSAIRRDSAALEGLVHNVESALSSELHGWSRSMSHAVRGRDDEDTGDVNGHPR